MVTPYHLPKKRGALKGTESLLMRDMSLTKSTSCHWQKLNEKLQDQIYIKKSL